MSGMLFKLDTALLTQLPVFICQLWLFPLLTQEGLICQWCVWMRGVSVASLPGVSECEVRSSYCSPITKKCWFRVQTNGPCVFVCVWLRYGCCISYWYCSVHICSFNSLLSTCGVCLFWKKPFAFHTSAFFLNLHRSFSKTKEVRHFLLGFLFYSVWL